jgi:2-phospho-L-lactate transferase/gluconeogenesis factor (CofD/UPF0052 family)
VPHGVKVRRGGVEIQEVKVREIGGLRVTVITSMNISAVPSKATVGDRVTVRGTIAPAIAAPITLVVKEPDGAVRGAQRDLRIRRDIRIQRETR